MARRLFAVLLSLVVVLVVVGFLLPASAIVERDRNFEQPPEVLFEVLSDLRHFTRWTPWLDGDDPDAFRLEGPPSGVGATLVWRQATEAGASRMWITAIEPGRRIDFDLEFGENEAQGWFIIEPDGLDQQVRWGLTMRFGALDLVGRYVGLMLPGLVGREYDRGLEQLDEYLQQSPGQVPELPAGLSEEALAR
jgi:uncharacterized protein YndB with AHSA1/START domain